MRSRSRTALGATSVSIAVALVATGCSSDSSGGDGKGGSGSTVRQLQVADEIDYDPAKGQSLGISTIHLIHRGLTSWDTSSGTAKVVPDLAADTGKPSDGGKTWTFRLKKNQKFSNGKTITAQDIKYGLERSFESTLSGGLSYHKSLLDGAEKYRGPFKGGELKAIQTPDDSTIVFHLNRPYGDWPWVASTPAFAPVPKAVDKNPADYGKDPVASGPYQVQSYKRGKEAVLVRNKYWKAKTAPEGHGKADKIILELGLDENVVNERLIADSGDDQYAYTNGVSVPASLLPKVNGNPAAKSRLTVSPSGALAYLAINNKHKPLDNVDVRKAINLAVDKKAFQVASGGSRIGGAIATTLIEPGLNGYQKYDPYGAPASGDVARAKKLLKKAGATKLKLTLVTGDDGSDTQQAQAIQESLRKAGIKVTLKPLDTNAYTEAITGDKGEFDLALSSWLADYPSAAGAIQPLFDSSQIGKGNYNISRYSEPEVDKLINAALGETDPKKAAEQWTAIDKRIQQDAPVVPLIYAKNAFLRGSKVTDFSIGEYPPYPNVLVIGGK